MKKIARALSSCLAVLAAGVLLGWLLVAGWTRQDAADVCSFLGYNESGIEYAINPVGYCEIDYGSVTIRVKVADVYAKYVRELRRKKNIREVHNGQK